MNELHLFAGAGGGILGGMLLGHTPVCAVEIEPYCREILLQRQRDGIMPKFPIWDDVTTFDGNPWRGKVDIVCGGFPCQDISVAGRGAGIEGERSGLWKEMARIVGEIRPRYVFIENSPLLRTRGLSVVLKDLAQMGYDARWGMLGGKAIGLCINGERIWILADASNCIRRTEAQNEAIIIDPKEPPRRQFERAISACSSSEAHSARLRDTHGLARDVDRLKSIGNGQIPSVAAKAFRILTEGLI
jgi:DNA (cytosine-5)-methyltransferase 1